MDQGNSFHNGQENLELQRKNRLGNQEDNTEETAKAPSAAPHAPSPQDVANLPPHKRPYVNIYATENQVTYPQDSHGILEHTAEGERQASPEHRGYTNIYARRVAERDEPYSPGAYGNTPDSHRPEADTAHGTPDGIPYYDDAGTVSRPTADSAEVARKSKLNIASLVLGIASFAGNALCLTCLTPIAAILAIVFGCIGRVEGRFDQKGLIGMILGIVYCAITLLSILLFIMAMIAAAADGVGEPL